ncbi:MAG: hypothetical protein LBB25_02715 [Holosporaceae bacterium]|nr:hypothetical protein [Holosporaceae bacterium]
MKRWVCERILRKEQNSEGIIVYLKEECNTKLARAGDYLIVFSRLAKRDFNKGY